MTWHKFFHLFTACWHLLSEAPYSRTYRCCQCGSKKTEVETYLHG
jgi:hypothetical protein